MVACWDIPMYTGDIYTKERIQGKTIQVLKTDYCSLRNPHGYRDLVTDEIVFKTEREALNFHVQVVNLCDEDGSCFSEQNLRFWQLWDCLKALRSGKIYPIRKKSMLLRFGSIKDNGGWTPELYLRGYNPKEREKAPAPKDFSWCGWETAKASPNPMDIWVYRNSTFRNREDCEYYLPPEYSMKIHGNEFKPYKRFEKEVKENIKFYQSL